jgi:hypothetical protein
MALDLSNPTVKALGYSAFAIAALLVVGSVFEGDETPRVRADGKSAKKRPISKVAKKAARIAEKQGDDDLAVRLERGEIRGDQLASLMKSGTLRRSNPDGSTRLVAKAFEESEEFHGNRREVVELDERDRYISPIGVVMGKIVAITYSAPNDSERAGAPWEHLSGDRGVWEPKAAEKPLLVADAKNGHPHIIQYRSPMKFSPTQGLVG